MEHKYSTNLIALIQTINPLSSFERIVQKIVKLIEKPKRAKQCTASRVQSDDEPQNLLFKHKHQKPQQQMGSKHQTQLQQSQQTYMQMPSFRPEQGFSKTTRSLLNNKRY